MPSNSNIVFAEDSYLRWTDGRGVEHETTHREPGKYARLDDGRGGRIDAKYPQICHGGNWRGNTISFADREEDVPRRFAADLGGRLIEERKEYEEERDRRRVAEERYNRRRMEEDEREGWR